MSVHPPDLGGEEQKKVRNLFPTPHYRQDGQEEGGRGAIYREGGEGGYMGLGGSGREGRIWYVGLPES